MLAREQLLILQLWFVVAVVPCPDLTTESSGDNAISMTQHNMPLIMHIMCKTKLDWSS
jgi:hypothetical protein